jgi:hypothetical protein
MGQNYDTGGALRRPFEAPTGTGTMVGQTMGLVAVTAALFTVGAYLARNLSGGWSLVFWIASLACLLAIEARQEPRERRPTAVLDSDVPSRPLQVGERLLYWGDTPIRAIDAATHR